MAAIDSRVNDYISRSAIFAQPILIHLREIVHKACPDVKETMKWSFPHFDYGGSIMCSMAAFNQHAAFGFWLHSQMSDPDKILSMGDEKKAMGNLGQLKSLKDLPSDKVMIKYIKEAMSLVDAGIKSKKKEKPVESNNTDVPAYFTDALKKNKRAYEAFSSFSPSAKKEYVGWLTEAKTDATRSKRLETALEWIQEGKTRHWKYK